MKLYSCSTVACGAGPVLVCIITSTGVTAKMTKAQNAKTLVTADSVFMVGLMVGDGPIITDEWTYSV